MKSLKEVLEGIEAFKKDMEELGVQVRESVASAPVGSPGEVISILRLIVKYSLEEVESQ